MAINKLFLFKMPPGKIEDYFYYQKKWLWFSGINVEDTEESFFYKAWSLFMMLNYICMHFVFEPLEAFMHLHDFETLIKLLSYLLTDSLGSVKIIVMYFNRKQVGKMLNLIESGVFLPNIERGGEQENTWIKRVVLLINRQTFFYSSLANAGMAIALLRTLYKRIVMYSDEPDKWEFPYFAFDTISGNRSPHWEIGWFYQGITRVFLAITLFGIDTCVPGMTAIVSVQFKMVQNNLRRLIQNTYREFRGNTKKFPDRSKSDEQQQIVQILPKDLLYKQLKKVVQYHLEIFKLTEDIEDVFNKLVLTVLLSTILILCLIMCHVSMYPLLSPVMLQDTCHLTFVMTQVLLYCYWGDEVTTESLNVVQAAFEVDFVGSDIQFQNGLQLIMRRSLKPVFLTAGKFANLSIKTFVMIIRASYSYFMVLRSNKH